MIEIFHFKVKARIIKLNAAVMNVNVQGNLMCHCRRENNMEKIHLTVKISAAFNAALLQQSGCSYNYACAYYLWNP
jgi:hypothetical protein